MKMSTEQSRTVSALWREGGKSSNGPNDGYCPPLQLVHLDFTSFKTTTNQNELPKVEHVLVIVDHFTRYTRAYMTKDQKALTATKIPYKGFISTFGAPERILTDQGKAFTSEVVEQLCSQFGISQLTITAYHPQGNGQVELAHQTLGRIIGKLEDEYKGQWPRHLFKLTHAYNSTRSAITSYSPHFLMFEQWPQLPIHFVFPTHEVMGTLRPVDSYVADLITALKKAFKVAQNMTQRRHWGKKGDMIVKPRQSHWIKGMLYLWEMTSLLGREN